MVVQGCLLPLTTVLTSHYRRPPTFPFRPETKGTSALLSKDQRFSLTLLLVY